MSTKQFLINRIDEAKSELDSLIKLISDYDQPTVEDELGNYFESLLGKISCNISFAEDLFTWKQRGLTIELLLESLETESMLLFMDNGWICDVND